LPITAGHLGAGLHAAGLSAAISSAAAAGLVGENMNFQNACSEFLKTNSPPAIFQYIKDTRNQLISKYLYMNSRLI
jgi:hypothetical protein